MRRIGEDIAEALWGWFVKDEQVPFGIVRRELGDERRERRSGKARRASGIVFDDEGICR